MTTQTQPMELDLLIVGGGIAGLWLLDEARRAGYQALLVESRALGSGQTVASQGILHGGMKHALTGRFSSFVDVLNEMPAIWRQCLIGTREPNLKSVRLRGDYCHCWRTDSVSSAFGQMGARLGLRSGFNRIPDAERPIPLKGAPGHVFRLEEQVADPESLITALAEANRERIILTPSPQFSFSETGAVNTVLIQPPNGRQPIELRPQRIALTAGEGNGALRKACGLSAETMRLLPLPILTLRGNLPTLNGFCLDGTKAKVVVTTHRIRENEAVWQVACERITETSLTRFTSLALKELKEALPGFACPEVAIGSYLAQRAEEATSDGSRSSDAHLLVEGNVMTAWPTKLVLAPRLTERILKELPAPSNGPDIVAAFETWPRPETARFPWEAII